MQEKTKSFRLTKTAEQQLKALEAYWGKTKSWIVRRAIAELYITYVKKG